MLLGLAWVGAYVLLVGVGSFLEQPLAHRLDAFQLDATLRLGALVLAIAALLVVRGPAIPGLWPILAGFGIGLVSGTGSVCYCLALTRLPSWLAASIANGYLAVTVILSVVVLGEALTWFLAAGLALTVAGVVALSWQGSTAATGAGTARSLAGAWPLGAYIVLIGTSTFLEKPALRHLGALQLNALTALGMAVVGVAAVGVGHRRVPSGSAALASAWIGVLFGLGAVGYYLGLARLPVSVAATLANTAVLVTVALAVLFRHRTVSGRQVVGAVTTLAGVCLLTIPHP